MVNTNCRRYEYIQSNIKFLLLNKKKIGLLKKLIESNKLIVNNDFNYTICLTSNKRVFIIDFIFSSLKLKPFYLQKFLEKYLSFFDYKLILVR